MNFPIRLKALAALALGVVSLVQIHAEEAVSPTAEPIPTVDALFADYSQPNSPGCALGVIHRGEFVYRRGYGMANLEHAIPISDESIFRIGSTSKQFTAMAIALLAEQGKLSLEDPLSTYFKSFPEWATQITVSQLVHHTSGIRDYLTLAYLAGKGSDQDYYTTDWVIKLLARQKETNFPPGTQHLYSNSGYLLLAEIVQRVSGMSLKEFSEKEMFGPLNMSHSHFHDDHTHIVPQRAAGYAPADEGYYISMTTLDIVGDGGVYTSINDLLLWDQNFYSNRLGDRGQALIEEVTTPATLADGRAIDYAFGLSRETYRGKTLISHGGAFVGFRAEMIRFPEQQFSAAILCNRSDASPTTLAMAVADHFLADELDPVSETPFENESLELSPETLQRYVGDFWEPDEAFAAETQLDQEKLWAVHSPARRNELVPIGENRFQMTGLPYEVIVTFELSGDTVVSMSRTIDGKPRGSFTPFERRLPKATELVEYRGDYFSPELDVEFLVRASDEALTVRLEDESMLDLTAMFDDTFENPDLGSFEFLRTPEGKIVAFKLQSGRVRNLVFYRKM